MEEAWELAALVMKKVGSHVRFRERFDAANTSTVIIQPDYTRPKDSIISFVAIVVSLFTFLFLAISEYNEWKQRQHELDLYLIFDTENNKLKLEPVSEDQLLLSASIVTGKLRPFWCVPTDRGKNASDEITPENNLLFPYYEILEERQKDLNQYANILDNSHPILAPESVVLSHSVPFGVYSKYLVNGMERTDFSVYKMNFEYPFFLNLEGLAEQGMKPIGTSRKQSNFGNVRFVERSKPWLGDVENSMSNCLEKTDYIEAFDLKSRQLFTEKISIAVSQSTNFNLEYPKKDK